jgi:phosphatidylinositol-3-phosphatase
VKAAALISLLVAALAVCTAAAAAPRVPAFDHVIVVMFENKEASSVIGSRAAPTFNLYARRYTSLTRYHGVTHPSLPNYIALVSGSTHGIKDDCTECVVSSKSLVDSLEVAGRSWKTYAEGLPSPGFLGPWASGGYAKKHNPFVYFRNVISSPERLARVVPLPQLAADLRAGKLPDFLLVVPNLCNSMHDCSVVVGDAWLRRTVAPLLHLPKTVIFVLFDEGSSKVGGGGHTAALALGTAVRPHVRYSRILGHYATLRTIEDAWGLPRLGQSARALPITGVWR